MPGYAERSRSRFFYRIPDLLSWLIWLALRRNSMPLLIWTPIQSGPGPMVASTRATFVLSRNRSPSQMGRWRSRPSQIQAGKNVFFLVSLGNFCLGSFFQYDYYSILQSNSRLSQEIYMNIVCSSSGVEVPFRFDQLKLRSRHCNPEMLSRWGGLLQKPRKHR